MTAVSIIGRSVVSHFFQDEYVDTIRDCLLARERRVHIRDRLFLDSETEYGPNISPDP